MKIKGGGKMNYCPNCGINLKKVNNGNGQLGKKKRPYKKKGK